VFEKDQDKEEWTLSATLESPASVIASGFGLDTAVGEELIVIKAIRGEIYAYETDLSTGAWLLSAEVSVVDSSYVSSRPWNQARDIPSLFQRVFLIRLKD
jgi:hypothetical protein